MTHTGITRLSFQNEAPDFGPHINHGRAGCATVEGTGSAGGIQSTVCIPHDWEAVQLFTLEVEYVLHNWAVFIGIKRPCLQSYIYVSPVGFTMRTYRPPWSPQRSVGYSVVITDGGCLQRWSIMSVCRILEVLTESEEIISSTCNTKMVHCCDSIFKSDCISSQKRSACALFCVVQVC